jgi:hypothetical protein
MRWVKVTSEKCHPCVRSKTMERLYRSSERIIPPVPWIYAILKPVFFRIFIPPASSCGRRKYEVQYIRRQIVTEKSKASNMPHRCDYSAQLKKWLVLRRKTLFLKN